METLDWALRYLADGYSIFPIASDKKPLLDWKEFQIRQATEEEVRGWWNKWPNAGIGIVTGEISGICVVDVEFDGDATIFPPTYTVRTGRGGVHLYYLYLEGVRNDLSRVIPSVDVRGEGGFVVAPPTVTRFIYNDKWVGGEYTVIDDAPKMPFPIELFKKAPNLLNKFDPKLLKGVTEGGRNQSAASVAGYLLAKIDDRSAAWEIFKGWNQLNKPPLPPDELKATFESILRREVSKQKEEAKKENDEIQIVPLKEAAEANTSPDVVRYSTGLDFLDAASRGGFGAGELWVIAAPQGQGKTTLAMEMTLNVASRGVKSLWLSYELMVNELWDKFKQMGAPENFLSYTTLKPARGDINLIEKTIAKAVKQENAKVVFIDHFGRLGGKIDKYDNNISSNLAVYLALIAERLKIFSLEHKVTIVLMAHTKKPQKGSKQTTADIANTSGLGNEATMSIILDREVDFNFSEDGDKYTGKLFVKVDKSRWGRETVKTMKFENGRIKPYDAAEEISKKIHKTDKKNLNDW
jgi:hypothetical protein